MDVTFVAGPVRVRAPATSANLGPGFDTLGLALALYDDVTARVTDGGCRVTVTGEGAGELPNDETHLVVRAMHAAFDRMGGRPPGLAVECVNRIPQARGLGSSSAAIVAGIQLARGLVADADAARPPMPGPSVGVENPGPSGARLDDAGALRLAAEIEGHPDNVAPCLLGGFTIAWTEPSGARAVHLKPAPGVHPTLFVPDGRGLTADARAALPATVPHADAARNAGRAALLVHAITADPALLFAATEDRLHQGYRAPGMPATAALVDALRAVGVAAVVSGAGPTVLALTDPPPDFAPDFATVEVGAAGISWSSVRLEVSNDGARIGPEARLDTPSEAGVAAGRKS
jgi:homoserine kinase